MKEKFEDRIVEALKARYPEYSVSIAEIKKTNINLKAIIIRQPDVELGPTIYYEGLEEQYNRGEITFNSALTKIVKIYEECNVKGVGKMDINKRDMLNTVTFRIINREKNMEIIETSPIREFLDLILVPYFSLKIGEKDTGSVRVTKQLLNHLGASEEEVFAACEKNAEPVFYSLPELLNNIAIDINEILAEELSKSIKGNPFMICSNRSKEYGAANFLMGDSTKKIADEYGEDVIILPSSIHEVIFVPASVMDVNYATEMVKAVNNEALKLEDYLSDHCYLYRRDTGEFIF